MINWILDKDNAQLTNSTFGNYANTTPKVNIGRTSYIFADSSWHQDPFVETWIADTSKIQGVASTKGYLWTTGASNEARKKNIYDVAGNVWEWTEETSFYGGNSNIQYNVMRGGSSANLSSGNPICFRAGHCNANYTDSTIGFRVVLYMK